MRAITVSILTITALYYYPVAVDGTAAINSCCDIAMKSCSYFSTTIRQPGICKIKDCCSQGSVVQGYCDTITDGGEWLVIQRRQQGINEDFRRFWLDYERGFGNLHSEFWYGLKSLNCLTSKGMWELHVDFTFSNGTKSYIHYNHFEVGPATNNYRLNVTGFTGNTPTDPFATLNNNGQQFSTHDRDNDMHPLNYAINGHDDSGGGWWHGSCNHIDLNYSYKHSGKYGFICIASKWYDLKFVEMKIRPLSDCGQL